MPIYAIIEKTYNAGPPGRAMMKDLDKYLSRSSALSLTEVREAREDALLNAETLDADDIILSRAFLNKVRVHYKETGTRADEPLPVDCYPNGSDGTEIMFIQNTFPLGRPAGAMENSVEDLITDSTLTLADVKALRDEIERDTGERPVESDLETALQSYYDQKGMDPDDPVTITAY